MDIPVLECAHNCPQPGQLCHGNQDPEFSSIQEFEDKQDLQVSFHDKTCTGRQYSPACKFLGDVPKQIYLSPGR